jgi:hypothetical protein
MSQTARIKTVITDLSALKEAINKLGWTSTEAGAALTITAKGSSFEARPDADGKYVFSGSGIYSRSNTMSEVNKAYAQIKLLKEINNRSGHGIIGVSQPRILADGRVVIEAEIDTDLLVG